MRDDAIFAEARVPRSRGAATPSPCGFGGFVSKIMSAAEIGPSLRC